MMLYLALFVAAAVNECVLAAWTQAVADRAKGKAILATLLLEAVRLPTLLLVVDAPLGSYEQIIRGVVATFGYSVGTYLLLSFGDKK